MYNWQFHIFVGLVKYFFKLKTIYFPTMFSDKREFGNVWGNRQHNHTLTTHIYSGMKGEKKAIHCTVIKLFNLLQFHLFTFVFASGFNLVDAFPFSIIPCILKWFFPKNINMACEWSCQLCIQITLSAFDLDFSNRIEWNHFSSRFQRIDFFKMNQRRKVFSFQMQRIDTGIYYIRWDE